MLVSTERQIRRVIRLAAQAAGYQLAGEAGAAGGSFQLQLGKYHAADYQVKRNSDYLQVQCCEEQPDGGWRYGRAVFSIRDLRDAFRFAELLFASAELRAKRQE